MGFWLNRSARGLVRLSSLSSWAPKTTPPPPLTQLLKSSVNNYNYFSTESSSPGGMNQESNPKDDAAFKADMPPVTAAEAFGYKFFSALLQNKPLPPPDDPDFHQFVDDLIDKLPVAETKATKSETDQSEKPKPTTSEMIKATSVFLDSLSLGLLGIIPKLPAFKAKGDNFNFTQDTNGLYLTVKVCGLPKEDIVVWVDRNLVLVASMEDVAPEKKVREAITMPDDHNYDPDEVTGTIMEDGQLKISFPVSKEGGEPKEKYFEVDLV